MEAVDDVTGRFDGRRVCVTGGAGFIGSHLCDVLVRGGAEVVVLDDLSQGRRENLAGIVDRIRFVHGSILEPAALATAVEHAEIVYHLAAVASVPRSVREPALYLQVNAIGTLHVLEAARAAGVGRFVYASSSSAYGDQPGQPRVETMTPDPRSPYAAAKCAGEYLVRSAARCHGLAAISLRFFNVFGPRQRFDSPYAAVVPLFVRALLEGNRPTVYGDGAQTRDFTHVDNVAYACLLAGACRGPLGGEVINIAAGRSASVLDLLSEIARRLGVEAPAVFVPHRVGEVRHSRACIDAARELIGYEPIVDRGVGLDETVRWYGERG
jgi:nucleoside-diphosphate-sugar epimerase